MSLGCFCCTTVSLLADMKQCCLRPSCQEAEEVLGALVGWEELGEGPAGVGEGVKLGDTCISCVGDAAGEQGC